jgi:protoporphyrinogen oxidase
MIEQIKYLIIGAGPTGLGAAFRLKELGEHSFRIIEKESEAGGLSRSFIDDKGFTWDIGGHVQFSHYAYFYKVMRLAIPENDWIKHQREAWVWIKDRFIPYPFQNNIHRLPVEDIEKCLNGLIALKENDNTVNNFEDWILQSFGKGIADIFLLPYNLKVWATYPKKMNYTWTGDRVANVDISRVIHNLLNNKDEVSWGPNNTFEFPKYGGTGSIWKNLASLIGDQFFKYNCELLEIDTEKKIAKLPNGQMIQYENILSTIPVNILSEKLRPSSEKLTEVSNKLRYISSHIIGIGLKGKTPEALKTKCWMYFPEDNCPFYRVTVFSNYSPNNVPDINNYWSLMAETSQSIEKPVSEETIIEETIQGLIHTKLLNKEDEIISTWKLKAPYGYPVPSTERDLLLPQVIYLTQEMGIYSRGRFGGWKYEVSNQDHSFMQGVEWVNLILLQVPETTYFFPNTVNQNRGK